MNRLIFLFWISLNLVYNTVLSKNHQLATNQSEKKDEIMNITIEFSFNSNFIPSHNGYLVVGVYSDAKTYDLITVLDFEEINKSNSNITTEMWDNYFAFYLEHTNKNQTVLHNLNLNSLKTYAITVFYDRNQNKEFNLFSYPFENYSFSSYRKKITWRKPKFNEISFSPSDYQNKNLVIKMKP